MKDDRLISYLKDELSEKERTDVEQWIKEDSKNRIYFNKIKFIWESSSMDYTLPDQNFDPAWSNIQTTINKHSGRSVFRINTIIKVAAIAVILIGFGLLFSNIYQNNFVETEWIAEQTFQEKGEIILPDGTHVWLNDHAEIVYPEKFIGKTREVKIKGEVFFDVEKNKRKPFIIHTGSSSVEVLGTSFNVDAKENFQEVKVTVVTGRVALYESANRDNHVILEPGDQGIYHSDDSQLLARQNKDLNFLAWKTGILQFENTPLEEVCGILSNHFDMNLTIADSALEDKALTAIYDNKTIDEVLDILQITLSIKCERKEHEILLKSQ